MALSVITLCIGVGALAGAIVSLSNAVVAHGKSIEEIRKVLKALQGRGRL